jgi:hypothetical protein
MTSSSANQHGDHVVFFIDQEKFTVASETITPRRIITEFAKEDAALTTLVLIHGNERTKLEALDTPFELKNGSHFTILHHGPTTVS